MKKYVAYLVIPIFALLWIVILRFIPVNKESAKEKMMQYGDTINLNSVSVKGHLSVEEVLAKRRSVRKYSSSALYIKQISQLLWAAYGITNEEGNRTAPSAGALYPIKIYLVSHHIAGVASGIYEYLPQPHQLIKFKDGDYKKDMYYACLEQNMFLEAAAVIVYSVNYKKVAARYGNRATRYADMDVAHSSQNVYLQAEALGIGTCAVGAFEDDKMQQIIGCDSNYKVIYLMPLGMKKN